MCYEIKVKIPLKKKVSIEKYIYEINEKESCRI